MIADVCIWGPIGNLYILKGKGATGPGLRQRRWVDLEDDVLTESINWVITEQWVAQDTRAPDWRPKVYTYTEAIYMPPGQQIKVGKNLAGGGTMFYYIIISDEKITSEEQAEAIVREAVNGTDGPGGDAGPDNGPDPDARTEQGTGGP